MSVVSRLVVFNKITSFLAASKGLAPKTGLDFLGKIR